ncbi:hypothetical protein [Actinoplanes italicus]|uniref:Uncharacterized protein n=1 Tax=Actinoplanes italicus TaxID=113567 RepID=A0A2T0K0D9_9ACTN|nr:hypothetical protein [Actinoplanes italicus]PRX16040.1 hypothetical protein CLV67_12187 [Actinoplanes italicus]
MDLTVVFIVLILLVAVWLVAKMINRSLRGGSSRRRSRSHSGMGYPYYVDGSSGSSDDNSSSSNDSGGGGWWSGGDSGGSSWGGGDSGGSSWGGGGDGGGGGSY